VHRTGTVSITSDAAAGPSSVALTGTGAAFGAWQRLGGSASGSPAVSASTASRVDVFARGQDDALYHTWFDGSVWHPFESLGGFIELRRGVGVVGERAARCLCPR